MRNRHPIVLGIQSPISPVPLSRLVVRAHGVPERAAAQISNPTLTPRRRILDRPVPLRGNLHADETGGRRHECEDGCGQTTLRARQAHQAATKYWIVVGLSQLVVHPSPDLKGPPPPHPTIMSTLCLLYVYFMSTLSREPSTPQIHAPPKPLYVYFMSTLCLLYVYFMFANFFMSN